MQSDTICTHAYSCERHFRQIQVACRGRTIYDEICSIGAPLWHAHVLPCTCFPHLCFRNLAPKDWFEILFHAPPHVCFARIYRDGTMHLCRVPCNELAGDCCNDGSMYAQVYTYGVIDVTELDSDACNYGWNKCKVTTVPYTELHQNLM